MLRAGVLIVLAALAGCAQLPPSGETTRAAVDAAIRLDPHIAARVARADPSRVARNIGRLAGFGTRHTCSDRPAPGRGVDEARDFILGEFNSIAPGELQTVLDRFTRSTCPQNDTYNVVAWLPGLTHPERLVIVGGHYDSRTYDVHDAVSDAPGANDSGSQSALVIEVASMLGARIGASDGVRQSADAYDNTLVFVTFSAEEQGGGAASFAANLARYVPGAKVVAMLNSDIVGGDNTVNHAEDLQRFRLYAAGTPRENAGPDGTPDNTSPARGLMRYVHTWGGAYVPSMRMVPGLRQDRPGRGSDHISFLAIGAPAVRFIETIECSPSRPDRTTTVPYPPPGYPAECLDAHTAHQHSPFDLFGYVTPDYTARIAQVVAATAASLARAPAPPRNVDVTRQRSGALELSWQPPETGAPASYVIAARRIDENFYRKRAIIAGDATRASIATADLALEASDVFYVSLAAVDAGGHESLFAYPELRCDPAGCTVPAGALDVTTTR